MDRAAGGESSAQIRGQKTGVCEEVHSGEPPAGEPEAAGSGNAQGAGLFGV